MTSSIIFRVTDSSICEGNLPVTYGSPSQGLFTRRFDIFFDLRLNKRLSKQSRRRSFVTSSHTSWRHYYAVLWMQMSRCLYVDVFVKWIPEKRIQWKLNGNTHFHPKYPWNIVTQKIASDFFLWKFTNFHSWKHTEIFRLHIVSHFVQVSVCFVFA